MPATTRRLAVAAALPAAALLLAGCSASTSSSSGSFAPAQQPALGQAPQHSTADSGSSGGGGAPAAISSGVTGSGTGLSAANGAAQFDKSVATPDNPGFTLGTPQGRIERSVSATFVVPHGTFLDAFDLLIQRAASLGGFVVGSSTSPDQSGRIDSGSLTVRVPVARLSDMIRGNPRDWKVSAVDFSSVDHTSETVDLQARLRAATAHRDALQGLLAGTRNLADITALEQQIAQVQQEVEQDQGALDAVNSRVDLATATMSLREQGAVVARPPAPAPRLKGALQSGWDNAVAVVAGITEGLLSALPLLVLAALGLLVAWRAGLLRRGATRSA